MNRDEKMRERQASLAALEVMDVFAEIVCSMSGDEYIPRTEKEKQKNETGVWLFLDPYKNAAITNFQLVHKDFNGHDNLEKIGEVKTDETFDTLADSVMCLERMVGREFMDQVVMVSACDHPEHKNVLLIKGLDAFGEVHSAKCEFSEVVEETAMGLDGIEIHG